MEAETDSRLEEQETRVVVAATLLNLSLLASASVLVASCGDKSARPELLHPPATNFQRDDEPQLSVDAMVKSGLLDDYDVHLSIWSRYGSQWWKAVCE